MVPQRPARRQLRSNAARRLDLGYASRRPQMIDDAIRSPEATDSDDFLVVNALTFVSTLTAQRRVSFRRDRSELPVVWHDISPPSFRIEVVVSV